MSQRNDDNRTTHPSASNVASAEELVPRASHDSAPPPALLDFMMKGWKARETPAVEPVKNHEAFHGRRRRLSERFPDDVIVVPTGHEKVRANDTYFRFRPGSDFYYLTGNLEPDCALVMIPDGKGGHRDVLFVEANPGRSDHTFFTDRGKGELWVGPRLGVEQSQRRFAVHECRALSELPGFLKDVRSPMRVLRGLSERVESLVRPVSSADEELATTLSEMRLIKDAIEIEELATAVDATFRGFEDVIRALKNATSEREIEGAFSLRARVEGNDVGYGTIAACGANACILHWSRNDGSVRPGELLLLDAGVEGHSLYTADITRTLPVSGRYSPEQREIHELVIEAQAAAFAAVKPGNDFLDPNRAAMKVLAHGLERLGILPMPAKEALKEENQFFKRYTLHNVSHMLGLDVHDCAQARAETYRYGKLRPGMVLTIEPGLYFQPDDLTVPERYRGIGVRIEDDVVVTEDGMRNLSEHIPRSADEVEAWMARVWESSEGGK